MAKSENSCFISAHRSYSYFLFLTVVGFGGDSYKKCRGVDRVSVHLTSGIAITVHSTSLLNGKRWATQRNEFGFSWFLIFKKKKKNRNEREKSDFRLKVCRWRAWNWISYLHGTKQKIKYRIVRCLQARQDWSAVWNFGPIPILPLSSLSFPTDCRMISAETESFPPDSVRKDKDLQKKVFSAEEREFASFQDPRKNCKPVDCVEKYNGWRNFFRTSTGKCESTHECYTKGNKDEELPEIVSSHDIQWNICCTQVLLDLGRFLTSSAKAHAYVFSAPT